MQGGSKSHLAALLQHPRVWSQELARVRVPRLTLLIFVKDQGRACALALEAALCVVRPPCKWERLKTDVHRGRVIRIDKDSGAAGATVARLGAVAWNSIVSLML